MSAIETGIADVVLRELKKFHDDRGWLTEIYRMDEIDHVCSMCYISQTKSGVARGPHEHKLPTDYFVFAGPGTFSVYLYDDRPESPTYKASFNQEFGVDRPAFLTVPPRVIHAYRCVSDVDGMVINLPDKLYAGSGKTQPVDETRHEDKPDSPFYSAFDSILFVNK